jgi:diguanylate cyclase (GGDEF)-like protein/PAS domain S-box-containing protein
MPDKKLLSTIADHVPSLVIMYDINNGRYLYVNKTVKKLLGYEPEELINGGLPFVSSLVHPDDLAAIMEKNQKALVEANSKPPGSDDDEPIISFEYRMRHKNGHYRWFQTDGTVFGRNAFGKVELVLNVSIDITERKATEEQLRLVKENIEQQAKMLSLELTRTLQESEEHFRTLVQAVEDYAIFSLDVNGKITSWNEGVEYILGYTEDEIVGKHYSILFTPDDIASGAHEEELNVAKSTGRYVAERLHVRKDASTFHAVVTCTAIRDSNGNLKGFSKIMRDITEKKEAEETIRYQAFHDTLTGLSNREGLYEKFTAAMNNAQRHEQKLALIFLDLDRFKLINDTLGHAIGDLILKEVADRLSKAIRKNDVVARLGGDEFILLLTEIEDVEDVMKVSQKIFQALDPVIRVHNQSLHVTASLGISVYPEDGADINAMLKNADVALYRAKELGRNRYQFYNLGMNLKSVERLALEQGLRIAATESQLEMVYQPYVEISSGKVMGVEALVRWNHPTMGRIMPGDFIPLAEETGMISPIGNWILRTVCAQGHKWHSEGMNILVSVNLSARQFAEEKIVESISKILRETRYNPRYLELEITETVAMENISRTSVKLEDLKKRGINISIDDFGTGYSSLNYLKRFPVHKVKIDKSFISQAIENQQDQAIVRAIVSMGNSMGLAVCAEGIENREQMQLLSGLNCGLAQGYLISKPLSAADLTAWLKTKGQLNLEGFYFPIR